MCINTINSTHSYVICYMCVVLVVVVVLVNGGGLLTLILKTSIITNSLNRWFKFVCTIKSITERNGKRSKPK